MAYTDPLQPHLVDLDDYEEFDEDFVPDPDSSPPNSRWDSEKRRWIALSPDDPDYDPTWGYTDAEGNPRVLDPHGDTREEKWLKSVYEHQGWKFPDADDGTDPRDGDGESTEQRKYKYYGTDPYQDWDVDLGYQRDAPAFEFEATPWVEPEPFTYPTYERLPEYESPEAFTAPSAEEVLSEDPGYQFRVSEGLRALQARAAQKGTLLGGATLKGLIDYGASEASQEYANAYDRRLRGYETNIGVGERAYGLQVGAAQEAYDRQRENAVEQAKLARENAYQAYTDDYTRSYQRAQDRYAPGYKTWDEQQRAMGLSAKAKFDRQWDAYKYAQPSATTIFQAGLD
jgi:hypothetical protein